MANILSIDLEMNQPTNTIIQVGYCIGNFRTGNVLAKRCFNIHTKEILREDIITLTGITQSDVDTSPYSLQDTFEIIKKDKEKYEYSRNPITWGCGDIHTYKEQLNNIEINKYFGRRYTDVKTIFITYCLAKGIPFKGGLSKSLKKLSIDFDGNEHNALDDAINTFNIYYELLQRIK
jgi:inhibitor of KinA sporulation pathway (predicted exonuclease)